jgi:preprotein translocase subunit SecG
MLTFLLVVHLLVTLGMVASILLQRSEGGGFVSSASSFMSARGSANFLTRLTAIFATLFIFLSLVLAIMAGGHSHKASIVDKIESEHGPAPTSDIAPAAVDSPAQPAPANGADASQDNGADASQDKENAGH